MKRYIQRITLVTLFSAICLIPLSLIAQILESSGRIGGPDNDYMSDVTTDSQNNTVVTGNFYGEAFYEPGNKIYSYGGTNDDVYIAKYDEYGDPDWINTIGGSYKDSAIAVYNDANDNVYVVGTFTDEIYLNGTLFAKPRNAQDGFLIKYDYRGSLEWAWYMGGGYDDEITGVTVDASGYVYVTGRFYIEADFTMDGSMDKYTDGSDYNAFVARLDPSGNVQWVEQIGTGIDNDESAVDIVIDTKGDVYVAGTFYETTYFDGNIMQGIYENDAFIAKYDYKGNFLWARYVGGGYDDYATSLTIDAGNFIYMAGKFVLQADVYNQGGKDLNSQGDDDIFLTKYYADGTIIDGIAVGGVDWEEAYSISAGPGGDIWMTGGYLSEIDFDHDGSADLVELYGGYLYGFLAHFDTNLDYMDESMNIAGITYKSNNSGTSVKVDWLSSTNSFLVGGNFDAAVDVDPNTSGDEYNTIGLTDAFFARYIPNREPTNITISNSTINENLATGTLIGSFTTTDPDLPDDSHTYSIVGGATSSFYISGSGLRSNQVFNYESTPSYSITVRTTDEAGLYYQKNFTINIINVNESPAALAISITSVDENLPAGTAVGKFTTTDPDAGESFTYTLENSISYPDNLSFYITNDTLFTNASFDYETKYLYTINVKTEDIGGLSYTKTFNISILPVNETPTAIALSNNLVLENLPAGTQVGTLSTTDPDAGDSHTYTLVSGTGGEDSGSFYISYDTLFTNEVFDYATQNQYSILVRSTDNGSLYTEQQFTIDVETGPLSGNYVIGPAGYYSNFQEAIDALLARGVGGEVTFNVQTGTYNEQLYIPVIPGASSTNTVTFKSVTGNRNDVILAWTSDETNNYTLRLDSTKHIIFRNMTVKSLSADYTAAVDILNKANAVIFNGCKFEGTQQSGTASIESLFKITNSDSLVIFDCNFLYGHGGFYGESLGGTSVVLSSNNFIQQNWSGMVLSNCYSSDIQLSDNTIYSTSPNFWYALYHHYLTDTVKVFNNKMIVDYAQYAGIYIQGPKPSTNRGAIYYNNFISVGDGNGILLDPAQTIDFYHNSLKTGWMDGTGSGVPFVVNQGTPNTSEEFHIYNNIFANYAGGYALELYEAIDYYSDYNDYYTTGPILAIYQTTTFPTLADWQGLSGEDLNSLEVDPEFIDDDNLHVANTELRAGTPIPIVQEDIDGEERNATTPFIGADENALYTDLLAWYPMDGDFQDISGSGRDLMQNGAFTDTTDAAGYGGSAIQFNGSDNYAYYSYDPSLQLYHFTILLWFRTEQSGVDQTLVGRGEENMLSSGMNYRIWIGSDNLVHAEFVDGSTTNEIQSEYAVTTDKWYYVAAVLDSVNKEFKLYVNGNETDMMSYALPPIDNPMDSLIVGANYDEIATLTNYFQGAMDELRIYPKRLTDEQILDIYADNLEPFSGIFTIGPSAGTDYKTITAAVNDLVYRGIDGPVEFNIESGNYDEQIYIPYIDGSDSVDVVFQSQALDSTQVTIATTANAEDNYTLALEEVQNITFRYLTFEAMDEMYGTVIELFPQNSNVQFISNRIVGKSGTTTGTDRAIVRRDWYGFGHDNNIWFWQNEFTGGSFGIYYEEADSLWIAKNNFKNQSESAITAIETAMPTIWLNTITSTATTYTDGIHIEDGIFEDDTYGYPRISRNKISIPGNSLSGGIEIVDYLPDSATGIGFVRNNFIHVNIQSGVASGIFTNYVQNITFYHNTVNLTNNANGNCLTLLNSDYLEFFNNILINHGGSYVVKAGVNVNEVYSDYNILYTTGPNLANIEGTDIANLAALQLEGTDVHSYSHDVTFNSESDLHVSDFSLAKGTPLASVTDDIDYDPRSTVAPYIGADEIGGASLDSLVLVMLYDSLGGSGWFDQTGWLTAPLDQWFGVTVENGRVTRLQITGNNLTGSLPADIGKLDSLHLLDLGNNAITGTIPVEIGNLSKLDTLGLASNQLSGNVISEIGNLSDLQALWLDNNQLTGAIPETFSNLSQLKAFYISLNQLSGEFPQVIGALTSLEGLGLSENLFTGVVPDTLANLTNLKYLYLNDNDLTDLPDLSALTTLINFNISGNKLTFEDIEPYVDIGNFVYSPMDSVGAPQIIQADLFGPFDLDATIGGTSNQYQWYKNDVIISGATSGTYSVAKTSNEDFGDYYCKITNGIATDLTLYTYLYTVENSGNVIGLAGTYYIKPDGTGDYLSFTEAINDLVATGVVGPVTIKVAAGTYSEKVTVPYIPGTSDSTNVVFQPDDFTDSTKVILTNTSSTDDNNYTIEFFNTSHVTFKNLTLKNYGTNYSRVVYIHYDCYNITLKNNLFSTPFAYNDFVLNPQVMIDGALSRKLTIQNNLFTGGATAVYLSSTYTDTNDSIMILQNVMEGQSRMGIYAYITNTLVISGNRITTISDNFNAIDISYQGRSLLIEKNDIYITPATEQDSQSFGIKLYQSNGESGNELMVINNFVHSLSKAAYGISVVSSTYVKIAHNTVWLEDQTLGSSAVWINAESSDISVINNILYANVGYAITMDASSGIISNYNDLATDGTQFCSYLGNSYNDLSSWQTVTSKDANSVSIIPAFAGVDDLHLTSSELDSLGLALPYVTDDIDGEPRNPTAPDMGADEFTAVQLPDLVVTSQNANPASTLIGNPVEFSGRIENLAGVDIRDSFAFLKIYLSSDDTYDESLDLLVATSSFDSVDAGGYLEFTLYYTFDATYDPGNYKLLFVVDPGNTILEENELNNISTFDFTLTGQPDLTLANQAVTPSTATIGQSVTLSAQIRNNGTDDLPGTSISMLVYMSGDSIIDIGTDTLLINYSFTEISKGGYLDFSEEITFDAGYAEGDYILIFIVDQDDAIDESLENNNTFYAPLTLVSAAGIDLTLNNSTVNPQAATIGQSVSLSTVVENIGDTDLSGTGTHVRIYLSADQTLETGTDSLIIEYPFTDLISYGTINLDTSYVFGSDYQEGDYYILFTVDDDDAVGESNENNNLFAKSFSLSTSVGVDLTLTDIAVTPTVITIGESADFSCVINNIGTADLTATQTNVRVYLSTDATLNSYSDPLILTKNFTDLPSGDTLNFIETYTFGLEYETGTYTAIFIVDELDAVEEGNENNNIFSVAITLEQAELPDLMVQNPSVSVDPINIYEDFNITCEVANIGTSGAASTVFRAFISQDQVSDVSDILLYNVTLNPISLAGSAPVNASVSWPSALTTGNYYVIFIADALDDETEMDETNNMATVAVEVVAIDIVDPVLSDATYPAEFQSGDGTQTYSVSASDDIAIDYVEMLYKGITDANTAWTSTSTTDDGGGQHSVSIGEDVFTDEVGLMFLFRAFDTAGNSDSTDIYYTYIKYPDEQAPPMSGLPASKDSTNYRIIAIPYVFTSGGNTVQAIFGDDLDSLKKSNIRMFGFNGTSYNELSASSTIQRGKGYWLLKIAQVNIDFGEVKAGNDTPDNLFEIDVSSGWNMIGNPYPFDIDWADVENANTGLSQFTVWEGSYSEPTDKRLNLFRGAFVRSDAGGTIQIPMVKYSTSGRKAEYEDPDKNNPLTDPAWKVDLTLESAGITNNIGGIGMHPQAVDQGDRRDKIILPRFINHLEVVHSGAEYLDLPLTYSVVEAKNSYTWHFNVDNNIGKERVTMHWDNAYFGDNDRQLLLIDLDNQVEVNMREVNRYEFSNNGVNHFVIKFGGPEILTGNAGLFEDAYPNPFDSYLKLRFNLPSTQDLHQVNLDVFSPVGTRVKSIASGSLLQGYHEIIWDGRDDNGYEVSPGIYIIRMSVDSGGEPLNYVQRVIKR